VKVEKNGSTNLDEANVQKLRDAEILLSNSIMMKPYLNLCTKLKWFQSETAGIDRLVKLLTPEGVSFETKK
jgi:phosphoglycerate dehydrogenase-like enzyme